MSYIKVNTENGDINPGDYLTPSSVPGVAMKATMTGNIVGQAMMSFDREGTGNILAFVKNGNNAGGLAELFNSTGTSTENISKEVLGKIELNTATTSRSDIFTDRLVAGLEIITQKITVRGLTVEKIGSVGNIIEMLNDVNFFGRPYFNSDMGGFAIIPQGQKKVEVTFDKEYVNQPVVNATISFNDGEDDGKDDVFFFSDTKYVITKKSVRGFTITLNREASADIRFSWIALAIRDAKTFDPRGDGGYSNIIQNNTASVIQSITSDNGSTTNNNANSTTSVLPTDISTTTEIEILPDISISSSSPSQIITPPLLPVAVEPAIIPAETTTITPEQTIIVEPVIPTPEIEDTVVVAEPAINPAEPIIIPIEITTTEVSIPVIEVPAPVSDL